MLLLLSERDYFIDLGWLVFGNAQIIYAYGFFNFALN